MDLATVEVVFQVVLVFGLIIFVHELGHFLVAKSVGVGVERFSLGFGPKLAGKRIGETEYLLSAIPLGGYVKMVGEEVGEEVADADRGRSFTHKSLPRRFLIVVAGPAANFLSAFVVFSLAFWFFGVNVPLDEAMVGGMVPDKPAQEAGLVVGDKILSVDGHAVHTWQEMAAQIRKSQGEPIHLKIERGEAGEIVELTVKPELRDDGESYAIGITPPAEVEIVSLGRAVTLGAEQTVLLTVVIFQTVAKLVSGQLSTRELGGPILIAQVAGQSARQGLDHLLHFTALINVNLAVFNLLPIPVLDGGHLLLIFLELLRGRPLSTRSREMAFRVGFLVILSLIVLVFYNDIARLVG